MSLLNPGIFLLSIVSGVAAWATVFFMRGTPGPTDARTRWIEGLTAVHIFRYIGLVALVPTHVDPAPFGWSFFYLSQVAWGDWMAGSLAMLSIIAHRRSWSSRTAILVAFVVIGTLDTLNAGASIVPQIYDQNLVTPLGWLILTIYVPGLVITELLLILTLLGKAGPKAGQ